MALRTAVNGLDNGHGLAQIRVYDCVHVFVNNFVISCPINTKPSAFYRKFRAQHLSRGRRNTRDFEHAKCGEVYHQNHHDLRFPPFVQRMVFSICPFDLPSGKHVK